MKHIILISGKDSAATAIIQKKLRPDIEYEYIHNDTSAEPPEVYIWLDKMEQYLGKKITRIGQSLEDVIYEQGILPSPLARYCTRMSKIYPLEDYIGSEETTVYYGLRADESTRIGYVPPKKSKITPAYPLRDLHIGIDQVWQMLDTLDLLPPQFFWGTMYDQVCTIIGVEGPGLISGLERFVFNSLFAWRTRPNCTFCFYQRQYEWIGLLEKHPHLYDQAMRIERDVGAANYTWIKGKSLSDLARNKEIIIQKRAQKIARLILQKTQTNMLSAMDMDDADDADMITAVSCGLFCGK